MQKAGAAVAAWLGGTIVALMLLLFGVAASAQAVLPVPPLTAHVVDQTGTFSEAQRQALEAKLAGFEASSGAQVVVLMVPISLPSCTMREPEILNGDRRERSTTW